MNAMKLEMSPLLVLYDVWLINPDLAGPELGFTVLIFRDGAMQTEISHRTNVELRVRKTGENSK